MGDVDAHTPMGSMVFTVMAALAPMELVNEGERITDWVAKRRIVGKDLGGRRPTCTDSQIRSDLRVLEGEGRPWWLPSPALGRASTEPLVGRSVLGMVEKVQRSAFATRDRAEGLAVLDQVYAVQGTRRGSDEDFSMSVSTAGVGPVRLERVCWQGAPAGGVGEHPGVLRVGQVLGGAVNVSDGRDALACRGPFLLPRDPYLSWWEGLDILTLSLDAAVVQDQARVLLGTETLRLEFTGAGPVSPALSRYWSVGVTHLSRTLQSGDEVMGNPLLQAEMTRSLVTALLHTFPNSFLERRLAPEPEPRPGSGGVRRAEAFIDAHLGEPIGIAEIAAAARMSPRGLHAAFRREKGTTPLGYLRARRLEAAHAELVAADPAAGVSVAVIAARWGFAHPGRFAAAYRDRYGRAPSATLHA